MDSGSSENVVSKSMVKAIGFPTEKHSSPYKLGWIKKGNESRVIEMFPFYWEILSRCHSL